MSVMSMTDPTDTAPKKGFIKRMFTDYGYWYGALCGWIACKFGQWVSIHLEIGWLP